MRLRIGTKIIYPSQGPCLVGPVVERRLGQSVVCFYQLSVLSDGGGDVFVPVEKIDEVGIRQLIKPTDVPELFLCLKTPGEVETEFAKRNRQNKYFLSTGSAFDLARLIAGLDHLRRLRSLSFGEQKLLEKALNLLSSEIADVLSTSFDTAYQQIQEVLSSASALPSK